MSTLRVLQRVYGTRVESTRSSLKLMFTLKSRVFMEPCKVNAFTHVQLGQMGLRV